MVATMQEVIDNIIQEKEALRAQLQAAEKRVDDLISENEDHAIAITLQGNRLAQIAEVAKYTQQFDEDDWETLNEAIDKILALATNLGDDGEKG